ncbi:MAG TPA: glycosyltransferase family 2 protein, partial [Burkholderiaceae bacterium]
DVLVIDNASGGNVVETLRAAHPATELIALPENLGWAGGNNAGIELGLQRGYRWICLLNNDTVFPDGAVAAMLASARELPPCLLHSSIYYWDEPDQPQLYPGRDGSTTAYDGTLWHGRLRMRYAYGACLAIHRDVFTKVGQFDERFFLQLEETDFYCRASAAGYAAVCDPAIRIFHKESRAFGGRQAPIKTYYTVRNSLLLIEKNREPARPRALKNLYWTIASLAALDARDGAKPGVAGVVKWLCSSSAGAAAVRYGLRDYLLRRFGRLAPRAQQRLQAVPAAVAVQAP